MSVILLQLIYCIVLHFMDIKWRLQAELEFGTQRGEMCCRLGLPACWFGPSWWERERAMQTGGKVAASDKGGSVCVACIFWMGQSCGKFPLWHMSQLPALRSENQPALTVRNPRFDQTEHNSPDRQQCRQPKPYSQCSFSAEEVHLFANIHLTAVKHRQRDVSRVLLTPVESFLLCTTFSWL